MKKITQRLIISFSILSIVIIFHAVSSGDKVYAGGWSGRGGQSLSSCTGPNCGNGGASGVGTCDDTNANNRIDCWGFSWLKFTYEGGEAGAGKSVKFSPCDFTGCDVEDSNGVSEIISGECASGEADGFYHLGRNVSVKSSGQGSDPGRIRYIGSLATNVTRLGEYNFGSTSANGAIGGWDYLYGSLGGNMVHAGNYAKGEANASPTFYYDSSYPNGELIDALASRKFSQVIYKRVANNGTKASDYLKMYESESSPIVKESDVADAYEKYLNYKYSDGSSPDNETPCKYQNGAWSCGGKMQSEVFAFCSYDNASILEYNLESKTKISVGSNSRTSSSWNNATGFSFNSNTDDVILVVSPEVTLKVQYDYRRTSIDTTKQAEATSAYIPKKRHIGTGADGDDIIYENADKQSTWDLKVNSTGISFGAGVEGDNGIQSVSGKKRVIKFANPGDTQIYCAGTNHDSIIKKDASTGDDSKWVGSRVCVKLKYDPVLLGSAVQTNVLAYTVDGNGVTSQNRERIIAADAEESSTISNWNSNNSASNHISNHIIDDYMSSDNGWVNSENRDETNKNKGNKIDTSYPIGVYSSVNITREHRPAAAISVDINANSSIKGMQTWRGGGLSNDYGDCKNKTLNTNSNMTPEYNCYAGKATKDGSYYEVDVLPGEEVDFTTSITHQEVAYSEATNDGRTLKSSSATVGVVGADILCGFNGFYINGNNKAKNYGKIQLITSNSDKDIVAGTYLDSEGHSKEQLSATTWLKPEGRLQLRYDACFGRQIAWDINNRNNSTNSLDWFGVSSSGFKVSGSVDDFKELVSRTQNGSMNSLHKNSASGTSPHDIRADEMLVGTTSSNKVYKSPNIRDRLDVKYQTNDYSANDNSRADVARQLGRSVSSTLTVYNDGAYGGNKDYTVTANIPYNYVLKPEITKFKENGVGIDEKANFSWKTTKEGRVNNIVNGVSYETATKDKTIYRAVLFTYPDSVDGDAIKDQGKTDFLVDANKFGTVSASDNRNNEYKSADGIADSLTILDEENHIVTPTIDKVEYYTSANGNLPGNSSSIVGEKLCIAFGIYPADSHNNLYYESGHLVTEIANDGTGANQSEALKQGFGDNAKWRVTVSCVSVNKKPLVSIEGHNLQSGGDSKSNVYTVKTDDSAKRVLGSWSEYGVFSASSNFGSGASYAYWGSQTEMNASTKDSGYKLSSEPYIIHPQSLGNYDNKNSADLSKKKDRYYDNFETYAIASSGGSKLDYVEKRVSALRDHYQTYLSQEKSDTTFVTSDWGKFMSPEEGDMIKTDGKTKDTIVFVAGNANVLTDWRIMAPVEYGEDYKDVQRIIFARNLYIDSGVENIKSIIVLGNGNNEEIGTGSHKEANGLLDTCSEAYVSNIAKSYDKFYNESGDDVNVETDNSAKKYVINSSRCNTPLTINGMVIANRVNLDRTFGAGGDSTNPNALTADRLNVRAEIFNYTPESVIWAYNSTVGEGVLQNTVLEELSTRY